MKSNKQRRLELKAKKASKKETQARKSAAHPQVPRGGVAVNADALAPINSYSSPDFVERGYYRDVWFTCQDCGKEETWTATQQKWWYEVAKGDVSTTARRCRPCRKHKRERRDEARRVHLDGIVRKAVGTPEPLA